MSRIELAHLRPWILALAAPAGAAPQLQVELAGGFVRQLTVEGQSLAPHQLLAGRSTGETVTLGDWPMETRAADDFDLTSYFIRTDIPAADWAIDLGGWSNRNGDATDFFVFEVGGNDALQARPIFVGGGRGTFVPVNGWSPVGLSVVNGPSSGQSVYGLSFGFDELRDAAGAPLAPSAVIQGVELTSSSIDGAAFLAVHPDPVTPDTSDGDGTLVSRGTHIAWHPLEVSLLGPFADELDDAPNPFLDLRLQVTFDGPEGRRYVVPGFFAADGLGGSTGTVWRARFAPDAPGVWTATVSLRAGTGVALELDELAGQATEFDGLTLDIPIAAAVPGSEGFLGRGRLGRGPCHYRVFPDGRPFLKGGTNSPENLLGYWGFDGIRDVGGNGRIHRFEPHVGDWQEGDPLFVSRTTGYDSKGLVGALNYLSSEGVNSLYLLPMNLGGDCQDTCPFVGYEKTPFNRTHYDVSRLEQWNVVLEHAQRKGLAIQMVLAETEPENENFLDGGTLGVQRKLFYRELVARFGHLLALKWNLSEENDFSVPQLREFADYLDALDAYDHPIGFHNHPNDYSDYEQVYGDTRFGGVSFQYDENTAGVSVEQLRADSEQGGWPWVVNMDEQGPWFIGLTDLNGAELRKRILYDVYFSGGNLEWYMGFQPLPLGGDLNVEDFRSREPMWRFMRYARRLLEEELPFMDMVPADALLSGESTFEGGGEVFMLLGEAYAIYLPQGTPSGVLDLTDDRGRFRARWFDPRTGEFVGPARVVRGGEPIELLAPPREPSEDWVLVLKRVERMGLEPRVQAAAMAWAVGAVFRL